MFIGGVDEAGRGPVIGPMVIVGVELNEDLLAKLEKVISKDSKGYSSGRREKLYNWIIDMDVSIYPLIIYPFTIDMWIKFLGGLNEMEAYFMSQIINFMKAQKVILDSCDNDPRRFSDRLHRYLKRKVDILCETNADVKYTVVSIASIIAKVIRDREIVRLGEEFGFEASGYPSDPKTLNIVDKWIEKHGYPPPFARWEWKTIKKRYPKDLF
jgi:ribonuclease HII